MLWEPTLEQQFIEAWSKSDSKTRSILTDIANTVDAELSTDPNLKGRIDLTDSNLITLAVPMVEASASVVYQVVPEDREVLVVRLLFRRADVSGS